MGEILKQQTCAAGAKYDMVGLKFGPHRVLMYYQTAFAVAAGVLMAAKHAARHEGVHPSKWSEMVNNARLVPTEPFSPTYRRTIERPNFKTWKIAFENNLVVFTFDDTVIKMHYSDAFTFYGSIRYAGKNAKCWAGDDSRQWTTRAVLTDAEANDKILYVH